MLAWPTNPSQTALVDLHDITRPRIVCTLTGASSLSRFYSATEISYAPFSASTTPTGTPSTLVRTDVTNQSTRTFASAQTGTFEAWDWSPDGKTLAYFAGDQLWLKAGNQPAASVSSFKKQGGRGGGWDDQIARGLTGALLRWFGAAANARAEPVAVSLFVILIVAPAKGSGEPL
jgi:hypothetical protein